MLQIAKIQLHLYTKKQECIPTANKSLKKMNCGATSLLNDACMLENMIQQNGLRSMW